MIYDSITARNASIGNGMRLGIIGCFTAVVQTYFSLCLSFVNDINTKFMSKQFKI